MSASRDVHTVDLCCCSKRTHRSALRTVVFLLDLLTLQTSQIAHSVINGVIESLSLLVAHSAGPGYAFFVWCAHCANLDNMSLLQHHGAHRAKKCEYGHSTLLAWYS